MILLAVEDADRDAPVRDLLTSEGWWVTTVTSKEEALRAAADHAPQLLILDRGMDDPASLLKIFGRERGGCGVLVLVDSLAEEAAGDLGDGIVSRDQEAEDIVSTVRGTLDAPRAAQDSLPVEDQPASADEQLTARELFGDILVDLGEAGEPVDEVAEVLPVLIDEEPEGDEAQDAIDWNRLENRLVEQQIEAEVIEADGLRSESTDAASEAGTEDEEVVTDPPMAMEREAEVVPIEIPVPSVEVPVPPDVAAVDALAAQNELLSPLEEALLPIEVDSELESASAESPAVADLVAGGGPFLAPPLAELDPLDGEPTTDLMEEVADLLESARDDWPSSDEPESGEGLSIEEVLAVEESAAVSEVAEATDVAITDEVESEPARESLQERAAEDTGAERERVGPYELLELAEFGDLTERWLARRVGGGGTVILERVRNELRNRADVRSAFVEGYSDAAGWEHENVLGIVDLGRDGDIDYVVTSHCPGRSLAEVLGRVARMEARMPLGISLLLVERMAAALEVLAASPATSRHGWLVPNSIWLGDEGEVVLREFGLGRLAPSEAPELRDWTEYRFSAPEKWSQRGDVRSDLYSLGAVFYEMVTGQPIHKASDSEALTAGIQQRAIAPAQDVDPTIPSEIDAWVMRLLRRNPTERPQSVPEVMAKIDLALQALPARPASAELNAYVRQLFAARVPAPPAPVAAGALGKDEIVAADSEEETSERARRRWDWWWLLIPLLALLSAFVGWKLLSGSGEAASLDDRSGSPIELAAAAPQSSGPQRLRLQ